MSNVNDEFDLDIRILATLPRHDGLDVRAGVTDEDTCVPQATCPADTCGLDCQTQTCPEATCGCNTIETCDQHFDSCSPQACGITFGNYCEDQTDDTCGCPGPGPEPDQQSDNTCAVCYPWEH